jgi:hypothetical protein
MNSELAMKILGSGKEPIDRYSASYALLALVLRFRSWEIRSRSLYERIYSCTFLLVLRTRPLEESLGDGTQRFSRMEWPMFAGLVA